MPKVHAIQAALVRIDGDQIAIAEGQAFDASEPVVVANRWLFVGDIEEATARPGERRGSKS